MKSTVNYMSPADFQLVLNSIKKLGIRKWSDTDIQMLFKILYWVGLRFTEGCTIKFENVDIERGEIILGKTKTEKYGLGIVATPFLNEFTEWLATKGPGELFPGLTYNTAIRWVYKLGELLDIPAWKIPQSESGEKTKSHIFRKTIGKDMLSGTHGKKAPLNIVSRQLRHKDIQTTEQYLKVGNEALKDYWDDQD